ncbi:hypothetical protein D3C78_1334640 [compost metagenome]
MHRYDDFRIGGSQPIKRCESVRLLLRKCKHASDLGFAEGADRQHSPWLFASVHEPFLGLCMRYEMQMGEGRDGVANAVVCRSALFAAMQMDNADILVMCRYCRRQHFTAISEQQYKLRSLKLKDITEIDNAKANRLRHGVSRVALHQDRRSCRQR